MPDNSPSSSPYQSDVHGVGDHRAVPTNEPATLDTPITITSYPLNHPKSYIGYVVALAATGDHTVATTRLEETVINAVEDARRGAWHLDLITRPSPDATTDREYLLTDRGQLVAEKAIDAYGSYENALDAFASLKGSTTRFAETHDVWETVGPYIAQADPAIAYFVPLMQHLHEKTGRDTFPLVELTRDYLIGVDAAFTVEFFFNDRQTVHDRVAAATANNETDVFTDVDAYRATVTYQLKTMLYHLGVLTEPGKDTSRLDPETDQWGLTDRLS